MLRTRPSSSRCPPLTDERVAAAACLRAARRDRRTASRGSTCGGDRFGVWPLTRSPRASAAGAGTEERARRGGDEPYVAVRTTRREQLSGAPRPSAIIERSRRRPLLRVYVWVDGRGNHHESCDLHGGDDVVADGFKHGGRQVARGVALHPWDDAGALKESWCLWGGGTALSIRLEKGKAMSEKERIEMLKNLELDVHVTAAESERLDAALG